MNRGSNIAWRKVVSWAGVALLAFGVWLVLKRHGWSSGMLVDYGRHLSLGWFIPAFLVLPLLGFPITPFLLLAGLRFGFVGGMGVTSAAMFFHHLAAYPLAHGKLRDRFSRWMKSKGHSIPTPPKGNEVWVTILFVSIHGPPYAAKLYLLALTEIPFRIYLWVGAPVYILFGIIPVGAGSSALGIDPLWLYGAIFAVMGLAFLGKWLRKRSGRSESAGS